MNLPGRPVAAFDPEGLIFAAGIASENLKLYDLRYYDKVTLRADHSNTIYLFFCHVSVDRYHYLFV